MLLIFTVGILILIFISLLLTITMIVEVSKREFDDESKRLIWMGILFFTNVFGSLAYYFLVYKKSEFIYVNSNLVKTLIILLFVTLFFFFILKAASLGVASMNNLY